MTDPPPDALPITNTNHDTTGLKAVWIDHNTFLVYGHNQPHFCYYDGNQGSCDCADFTWRDRTCKHLTAIQEKA